MASIPYLHNASHRIRFLASRYDTKVVFSGRFKLASMCNMINRQEAKPACEKKHAPLSGPCCTEKVYSILLKCGAEYIGQTGRCINDRLREHENEATSRTDNPIHPIAVHANECIGCAPDFAGTKRGHRNHHGREIIESFLIQNAENNVLSASAALSRRELEFLKPELEKYRNSP